jgi:hypothetical protein
MQPLDSKKNLVFLLRDDKLSGRENSKIIEGMKNRLSNLTFNGFDAASLYNFYASTVNAYVQQSGTISKDAKELLNAKLDGELNPLLADMSTTALINLKRCLNDNIGFLGDKEKIDNIIAKIDKLIEYNGDFQNNRGLRTREVKDIIDDVKEVRTQLSDNNSEVLTRHLWTAVALLFIGPLTSVEPDNMVSSFNNITVGKEDDVQNAYPAGMRYYVIAHEDFEQ